MLVKQMRQEVTEGVIYTGVTLYKDGYSAILKALCVVIMWVPILQREYMTISSLINVLQAAFSSLSGGEAFKLCTRINVRSSPRDLLTPVES